MNEVLDSARSVLFQNKRKLLAKANVVAAGVGYKVSAGKQTDALSIVCSVVKKKAASALTTRDLVPKTLQGIPTDVVETGRIRIFQSRTTRHRPAPGGVSVGHYAISAGTLGCLVKRDGERLILSNNHVLANSNEAEIGDPILQPGSYDGGRMPDDQIAELYDFVPVEFPDIPGGCNIARGIAAILNGVTRFIGSRTRLRSVSTQAADNLVDAAIARPLQDEDVSEQILDIGTIQGLSQGELGMAIKKSGRTTAFTEGSIQQVDVTVNVQYGPGRLATFSDQLMAGPMSQGGDSGSAVLNENNELVGLLFAGGENSTIINRIEHVFSALNLTL